MRIPWRTKAHSAPTCYATITGLFGCIARKRPNTIPIASKLIPPATMIGVVEMRSTHRLAIATPTCLTHEQGRGEQRHGSTAAPGRHLCGIGLQCVVQHVKAETGEKAGEHRENPR
jgi:hypothetical protein